MRMTPSRHISRESGFSIVEVIVAMGILATALVAVAQMFAVATTANRNARTTTFTTVLAQQKMEQLRSLTWGFDALGLPASDTTTDLTVVPEQSSGGVGLSPSPAGSLTRNTPGYVDYLGEYGQWLGTGATLANGTIYIRRWSVEPLPTNPNNTLILQVLVTRNRDRGGADTGAARRLPYEARLVSVKTRKSS